METSSIKYRVVEVPQAVAAPDWDDETSNLVAGLELNPGFQALMLKLKLRKAAFDSQLSTKKHDTLREVDFLQAHSQACGWLEREVRLETSARKHRVDKPRDAYDIEQRAFESAFSVLELVGDGKGL